jgi:hypothetical protein
MKEARKANSVPKFTNFPHAFFAMRIQMRPTYPLPLKQMYPNHYFISTGNQLQLIVPLLSTYRMKTQVTNIPHMFNRTLPKVA